MSTTHPCGRSGPKTLGEGAKVKKEKTCQTLATADNRTPIVNRTCRTDRGTNRGELGAIGLDRGNRARSGQAKKCQHFKIPLKSWQNAAALCRSGGHWQYRVGITAHISKDCERTAFECERKVLLQKRLGVSLNRSTNNRTNGGKRTD